MFVKVTVVLSLLLFSLLSAQQSFASITRSSSGRTAFYRHAITTPTLVNTDTSLLTLSQFSQPVKPMLNPDPALSASSRSSLMDENSRMRINQSYGKLPLRSEVNAWQTVGLVKFLTRGSSYLHTHEYDNGVEPTTII